MQLERVITMTFLGWGGEAELESNKESYRRRYLNAARNPKLAEFDEYQVQNETSNPSIKTKDQIHFRQKDDEHRPHRGLSHSPRCWRGFESRR